LSPHPSTQAAAKVQPLTKAHHLLRGTAPFTLRSLLAAPRRGDVVADWGAANLRLLVLNPAGAALGTVDFAARAFCGGRFLTAGEVPSEAPGDGPALGGDWHAKFVGGSTLGSPAAAAAAFSSPAHGQGGPFQRRTSPMQGAGVMESVEITAGTGEIVAKVRTPATSGPVAAPGSVVGFVGSGEGFGSPRPVEPLAGAGPATMEAGGGGAEEADLSAFQPSAFQPSAFQPSAFQPVDVSLPDVGSAGSAGSAGTPRCAASVTLRGDVAALAPNTPPRRAFEKKFVADIADALSVEAACVTVLGLRSGSIIVDFLVEKEGADHGGFVGELRRQVLDPSSPLLNGKVTHSCVTVAGEVELYVAGQPESPVRSSGNFEFNKPRDSTLGVVAPLPVPGSGRARRGAEVLPKQSTDVPPVGVGGRVPIHGEVDRPAPLFYFPGAAEEEVKREKGRSREEETRNKGDRVPEWPQGKKVDEGAERALREAGLLANGDTNVRAKTPDLLPGGRKREKKERSRAEETRNKGDQVPAWPQGKEVDEEAERVLREAGLLAGGDTNIPAKSEEKEPDLLPGGSVLAQMLKEMRGAGGGAGATGIGEGGSVLARMFVELLAVQRQAMIRGSIDGSMVRESMAGKTKTKKKKKTKKEKGKGAASVDGVGKKLKVDVEDLPPPPPAMSPKEEEKLHAFFKARAKKGTVGVGELLAFLKGENVAFDEAAFTGGVKLVGDERVDWEGILDSLGGGTLESVVRREEVGFALDETGGGGRGGGGGGEAGPEGRERGLACQLRHHHEGPGGRLQGGLRSKGS
jgi:hypothetical protein